MSDDENAELVHDWESDCYVLRDEITRLRADLAAEKEQGWKAHAANLSLAEDNNDLRADLAAVTAERDRMREALKPFADAASGDDYIDDIEIAETDTARKITFGNLRRARAALEGVTEPASPKAETEFFVFDEFAPLPDPAKGKSDA